MDDPAVRWLLIYCAGGWIAVRLYTTALGYPAGRWVISETIHLCIGWSDWQTDSCVTLYNCIRGSS
jgi:hypothetical protein